MKARILCFLLAGGLLALGAWLVHGPNPPQTHTPRPDPAADPVQAEVSQARYLEIVQKGLGYLVKNQHADGHWEGDGGQHPVAMTGLVGLALLMDEVPPEPNTRLDQFRVPLKGKYSANILRAVDWLMDRSQPRRQGLIFSEHASETTRYMEGHGLATIFLAGVANHENDKARQQKLSDVLTRAVKYIARAQSSCGGWYRTSRMEGHDLDEIRATVIQIQALQAGENAGIPIPNHTLHDGQEYLTVWLRKHEGAGPWPETAAALAGLLNSGPLATIKVQFSGGEDLSKEKEHWLKDCRSGIPVGRAIQFGRDDLTHYYYSQAAFGNRRDDAWKEYRSAMFGHLQSSQNQDGSWPAGNGISGGLLYSTALWCTILQLEKESHPSTQALFPNLVD